MNCIFSSPMNGSTIAAIRKITASTRGRRPLASAAWYQPRTDQGFDPGSIQLLGYKAPREFQRRVAQMRAYDSALFGTLPSPSTFHELVPLLHEPVKGRMVRMWRGQGDIDWPIHSTAYRRLADNASRPVDEKNVQFYEEGPSYAGRAQGI